MMLGSEFKKAKSLGTFQRFYISMFGMPILGLRIRAWRMLPLIKRHVAKASHILDFGSGRGVFTVQMALQNPNVKVLGVDLNETKIEDANRVAKSISLNNCLFEAGDFFEKPLDKGLDAIVAIDVLEHIEDDVTLCKKFYEALSHGGKLIIHVPHYYRYFFGVKRPNFDIEGHVRTGYLMHELEDVVKKSGLSIIEKGHTYSSVETIANDLSYVITQGREKRKLLYAISFPFLLMMAWLGKFTTPSIGSGVYMVAEKTRG